MSSYGGSAAIQKPKDGNWLHSQFQQACASVLQQPPKRRGPFLIDDKDLDVRISKSGYFQSNSD